MKEISFFFSAISTSKLQAPKQDGDDVRNDESNEETVVSASQLSTIDKKIFPAITYWAACQTPNGAAVNPLKLQQALVKCGVEVYMCKASSKKGCQHLNKLCQALKDHKNQCMMDLVASSYQHCLSNLESEMALDSDSIDYDSCTTENVVRLRVKEQRMKSRLTIAAQELRSAGLLMDCFGLDEENPTTVTGQEADPAPVNKPLSCPVTVLCNDIQLIMEKLEYAVHQGEIFKRDPTSKYTYKHLCTMKTFLLSFMGNDTFKDRLVQHNSRVLPILSDPESCVIPQLKIVRDLVEVNDGWFWSFSSETFVHGVLQDAEIGQKSPRAFVPYDRTKDPEPLYFEEILRNSLSDDHIQRFCQDFLALFRPKQHKQPVPCAIGASDSGKTSLFSPVFQIVPMHRIARVTKQKAFNKSMIDPSTEIIFLDEAYENLLDVDDWKILCQGGYTSHDTKWKRARGFNCQAAMYITCQTELDFGEQHNPAMDRRLHKYFFQSLPNIKPEVHQWLREHAMDCIVWASRQAPSVASAPAESTATDLASGLSEQDLMEIITVQLSDESAETPADAEVHETSSGPNSDDDEDSDVENDEADNDDELDIVILRKELDSCDPVSLKGRQLRLLLVRAEDVQKQCKQESRRLRQRQLENRRKTLIEFGVIGEREAVELITDLKAPLSADLQKKWDEAYRERKEREEVERKERELYKVKTVFGNPWLVNKEREMAQLVKDLAETMNKERKAALKDLLAISRNKVRMFHEKEGTLSLSSSVMERERLCVELGLLKQSCAKFIIDVYTLLPIWNDDEEDEKEEEEEEEEKEEKDDDNDDNDNGATVKNREDEEEFFTPPPTLSYVPRYDVMATSPPRLTRTPLPFRRKIIVPETPSSQGKRRKLNPPAGQKKVTEFFSSQP